MLPFAVYIVQAVMYCTGSKNIGECPFNGMDCAMLDFYHPPPPHLPLSCMLLHASVELPTQAVLIIASALGFNNNFLMSTVCSKSNFLEDSQPSAPTYILEHDNAHLSFDNPGVLSDTDSCCNCRASIKNYTVG